MVSKKSYILVVLWFVLRMPQFDKKKIPIYQRKISPNGNVLLSDITFQAFQFYKSYNYFYYQNVCKSPRTLRDFSAMNTRRGKKFVAFT